MTMDHNMTPTETYILKIIIQRKSISTTIKHNVTTNVKADDHNNTSIKTFRPSYKIETDDTKITPILNKRYQDNCLT